MVEFDQSPTFAARHSQGPRTAVFAWPAPTTAKVSMGSTIQAQCSCGYESDMLHVGGGMADMGQRCMAPALSNRTGTLVLRNFWGERSREDKTAGATFYTHHSLHRPDDTETARLVFEWHGDKEKLDFVLANIGYKCPKCERMKMRYFDIGLMWD